MKLTKDLVISGIAGRYPEAQNFEILWEKLIAGVPLYSSDDRRWPVELLNLPKFFGKVDGLTKMDADFFGIDPTHAHYMDPQVRILHEVLYEAIWDAGIDPGDLRGTKTGLFIGACYDDTTQARREDDTKQIPFLQISAGRIAYAFDFRGPVSLIDTACASSFSCIHEALLSLNNGTCDRAIVAGLAIHLRPLICKAFHSLNMLSTDGLSKCLDKDADGYQRSEGIVALIIERQQHAKRVYAHFLNCRTNTDGYKSEGITFPKYSMQCQLMKETYAEANVDPLSVDYIEAHVTGTKAGDPVESQAILDALRPNSTKPIMFGCLKSNMGHTEGASAICSISKVAKIFQKGWIPPNINFNEANPNIEGLMKGIIKPVLEKTRYEKDIIGVNSFGFGGVNVHAILKANPLRENEDSRLIANPLPRLINVCNRTREGLVECLKEFEDNQKSLSRGQLQLIHEVSKIEPSKGMIFRGMLVLNEKEKAAKKGIKEVHHKKPLWYIFSPLGCQWQAMGRELSNIRPCWESLLKSHEIAKELDCDLIECLTNEKLELTSMRDVLISITAIQIAIVDLFTFVGLKPDGIVGHSVGEVAAGYADGSATREQSLKTAYHIARIGEQKKKGPGSMAAVGLSWSEAQKMCPPDVQPACDNASDIVTIAGARDSVTKMIKQLNEREVFAKEVSCHEIAFHSDNVAPCHDELMKSFSDVYQSPRARSKKWISCSAPEDKKDLPEYQQLTATYYTNMVLAPVKFYSAVKCIPKDAAIVEIGPSSIMLGLVRKELGSSADYIPTMKKDTDENVANLLASIGGIYMAGHWPQINRLYPQVEYPVPRETGSIGHLLKWDHSKDWQACKYPEFFNQATVGRESKIEPMSRAWRFLTDHVVDGRILFPATGYLYIMWQHLGYILRAHTDVQTFPIVFRNIRLKRATMISTSSSTLFKFEINERAQIFEISESGNTCVSGSYEVPEDLIDYKSVLEKYRNSSNSDDKKNLVLELEGKDVYKELRVRGYDYGPAFQGIVSAKSDGTQARIKFIDHWISFADACLQVSVLAQNSGRNLMVPTFFEYVRIDPEAFFGALEASKSATGNAQLDVYFDPNTRVGITNGIILRGMRASLTVRRQNFKNLVLEDCRFVPYCEPSILSDMEAVKSREHYHDICNRYLDALVTGQKEDLPEKNFVKKYLEDGSDNFSLLKILHPIVNGEEPKNDSETEEKSDEKILQQLENPLDELSKQISESQSKLVKDSLVNRDVDTVLRSVVDIVAENSVTRSAIISEINFSHNIMVDKVNELLSVSGVRCQSCLIHPNPEDSAFKVLPCRVFAYSPELNKQEDLKESNLVILSDEGMSFCPKSSQNMAALIKNSTSLLKNEGFLFLRYRTKISPIESKLITHLDPSCPPLSMDYGDLEKLYQELELVKVCEKIIDNGETVYVLLRKMCPKTQEEPVIIEVKRDDYSWIEDVKKAVLENATERRVWLTSIGDTCNGIAGFVNCLKREPGGGVIRCLFAPNEKKLDNILKPDMMAKDLVMNVVQRGLLGSYRHVRLPSTAKPDKLSPHVYLDVQVRGDLTSLQWFEAPQSALVTSDGKRMDLQYLPKGSELVNAYYCALNFKDIMVATGRVTLDAYPASNQKGSLIGMEFSGIDSKGRRVLGMCQSMGVATTIVTDSQRCLFPVPDNWSLEEASTVPVTYLTCYYALFIRGHLRPGETVLIHAGSGGVGQAAISICLRRGCRVYTTVGTQEKREFLKKKFPQLTDEYITDSRSTEFQDFVLKKTDGRGVDLVLNSLSDEKLQASLRCLADGGRFIEIGKYDLLMDSPLDPHLMDINKSYDVCCVAHLMDECFSSKSPDVHRRWDTIREMFKQGLENGEVKPLSRSVFSKDEMETAFRFMANGKHIGKVLVKIRDEVMEPIPIDTPIPCIGRTYFNPRKSYIIAGGLGGVGLELAYWMVDRGATKLVLTSRVGIKNPYQEVFIHKLQAGGLLQKAEVIVSRNTATSYLSAALLVEEAQKMGPIGGIFNLAMVLKDAILENQNVELFQQVCAPKVSVTYNLDKISRQTCPELDFFACFSSAASGKGNPGQTNYGFANSVMERICEKRRRSGLHGLAIQWGAIGDVGVVAESLGGNDVVLGGTIPQRIKSCMEVLDRFMQSPFSVASSIVMADSRKSVIGGSENLLKTIYHILGVTDPSTLDPKLTLSELGMDSLMAVEIKQGLERDYDIVMTTQALRNLTVKELQQLSVQLANTQANQTDKKSDTQLQSMLNLFKVPTEVFTNLTDIRGPPIFFFPPIEGNFATLKPIADQLQAPIIGVNWTSELDKFDDLESIVSYYVEAIIRDYPNTNQLTFIGYSFGGLIALLTAIELQEKSSNIQIRTLGLLDSSPALLRSGLTELLKRGQLVAEEEAYVEMLISMAMVVTPLDNTDQLKTALLATPGREAKIKKLSELIENVKGIEQCDAGLIGVAADRYFKKMKMVYMMKPTKKFIGDALLIKSEENILKTLDKTEFGPDYGLSEVISGKVQVINVKGDHKTFLLNNVEEIASHLDSNIVNKLSIA
ncbi:fatty acid synthase-like [Brevipalpus obovatus]|uniref:fatty acid synthase-like n=1 Tax=Brevipalpus obovatus TaxID=246614 RepID=UPI003D9E72FC